MGILESYMIRKLKVKSHTRSRIISNDIVATPQHFFQPSLGIKEWNFRSPDPAPIPNICPVEFSELRQPHSYQVWGQFWSGVQYILCDTVVGSGLAFRKILHPQLVPMLYLGSTYQQFNIIVICRYHVITTEIFLSTNIRPLYFFIIVLLA